MLAAAGPQVLLVLALKYQQSQKFKKGQSNWNPDVIRGLIQQAWGVFHQLNESFENGIHCDVRKDFNETTKGLSRGVKE